ncbi:MAG: hypothetical protein ACRD8W_18615 [Nitrososphaeraceae archaeon]
MLVGQPLLYTSRKQEQYEEQPGIRMNGVDDVESDETLNHKWQQHRRVIYQVHEGHRSPQTHISIQSTSNDF